ncbi:MAG TPA: glycosyltransferase family 39 protein [Verrucomicrobiae bacterium]|jgi:4-amino-4-deoxy-L-arabinose transferase-like glycosyltransferase
MQSLFEKLARYPERTVVLLSLGLLLAGNWILPLTDRDEVRFAEASREMIQRGDYIVPWFNGDYRFDKPILIYWCQIASYKLLGENNFAARLPTALFTMGIGWLLVRWGRKLADAKTGLMAGVMFVAGLHVAVLLGRVATADMALIFFFTLAFWSGWELTRPEQPHRARWWWIFYVALALGFLAKGPEIWLALLGLILGRGFRRRDFSLPVIATIAGFVLSVGLVGLWGIPAMLQTQGKFLHVGIGEHVIDRSIGVTDGHGISGFFGYLAAVPLYLLTFFISFFPWSPRVPATLKRWWATRQTDSIGWYLLVQAAIVFAVFSLVRTKLPHYTIPAFPCLALWLALQIRNETNSLAWFGRRAVGMTLFVLVVTLGLFPVARAHFLSASLWHATQQYIRPETKIGCYGFTESSLVWELRAGTTNRIVFGDQARAADFLTNQPPFMLVLPTSCLTNLPDTNGVLIRVRGLDMVKFKNRDLTAIVRP